MRWGSDRGGRWVCDGIYERPTRLTTSPVGSHFPLLCATHSIPPQKTIYLLLSSETRYFSCQVEAHIVLKLPQKASAKLELDTFLKL